MILHGFCRQALELWHAGDMTTFTFIWYCNIVGSREGAWALALAETWT